MSAGITMEEAQASTLENNTMSDGITMEDSSLHSPSPKEGSPKGCNTGVSSKKPRTVSECILAFQAG
jgi:hypothetical protein